MFKLFDTHSHLNFPDFDNDRNNIIEKTLNEGVGMIIVGTCADDSARAIEIAGRYDSGVYASVGFHPANIRSDDFDASYYRELAKNPKAVAVGECGLDYFRQDNKEKQKEIFKKQVELALELDKPLIVHCRDARPLTPERSDGGRAHDDVLGILNSYRDPALRGDIHFFSGDWERAQKYFELGFLISFTGVVTFQPATLQQRGRLKCSGNNKKISLRKNHDRNGCALCSAGSLQGQAQ